ncbi:hypothetical protein ACIQLG_16860 [Terribacillus saccharophilus]
MSKVLQAFMFVGLTAVIISLIAYTTFDLMSNKNQDYKSNIESNHQL